MTKLLSLSPKSVTYASMVQFNSKSCPGVTFAVKRISLARRLELLEKLRAITLRQEFLDAGGDGERLEAAIGNQETNRLLLEWGLARIDGLLIDGVGASVDTLIESGPEELSLEIVAAVQSLMGLSEDERKNF